MQAILLTFFLLVGIGQDPYTFYSLSRAKKYPDRVERLVLTKEKLRSIPDSLYLFDHLIELDLSHNKIDLFSADIDRSSNLQRLDLSSNQISVVPPQIGNLRHLRELDLSRNKIDQIPDEIGKLKDLEVLTLHGNPITRLPKSVQNLGKLKVLDLRQMEISESHLKELIVALPEAKILHTTACSCGF